MQKRQDNPTFLVKYVVMQTFLVFLSYADDFDYKYPSYVGHEYECIFALLKYQEWPRSSWTTLKSAPFSSKWVAKEWRRV